PSTMAERMARTYGFTHRSQRICPSWRRSVAMESTGAVKMCTVTGRKPAPGIRSAQPIPARVPPRRRELPLDERLPGWHIGMTVVTCTERDPDHRGRSSPHITAHVLWVT